MNKRRVRKALPVLIARLKRVTEFPRRFRWTQALSELLGRIPDAELARRAGVSAATVGAERRRRGIEAFGRAPGPAVGWTSDMIALLGTASDANVAARLSVAPHTVSKKRRLLRIPPFAAGRPGYRWSPRALELLGALPDAEIARRLGFSVETVRLKREDLHIPAFGTPRRRLRWTKKQVALLGTMTDEDVAARLGTGRSSVKRQRERLGIAPYHATGKPIARVASLAKILPLRNAELRERYGMTHSLIRKLRKEYGIAPPDRHRPWPPGIVARMGKEPDTSIARAMNVTAGAVTARRNALGIRRFQPDRWSAEHLALLGTLPDSQIAQRVGVAVWTVGKKRRQLGVRPGLEGRKTTQIVGVYKTTSRDQNGWLHPRYRAAWRTASGKRVSRSFSVKKHDERRALKLAIEARRNGVVGRRAAGRRARSR
jgi:hypothetical protein